LEPPWSLDLRKLHIGWEDADEMAAEDRETVVILLKATLMHNAR